VQPCASSTRNLLANRALRSTWTTRPSDGELRFPVPKRYSSHLSQSRRRASLRRAAACGYRASLQTRCLNLRTVCSAWAVCLEVPGCRHPPGSSSYELLEPSRPMNALKARLFSLRGKVYRQQNDDAGVLNSTSSLTLHLIATIERITLHTPVNNPRQISDRFGPIVIVYPRSGFTTSGAPPLRSQCKSGGRYELPESNISVRGLPH
jgi:hypothetical protein